MTVTAETLLNLPTARMVAMVANSDHWREWLGVSTEDAALERIHIETAEGHPLERPFCVVTSTVEWTSAALGAGPSTTWGHRGTLHLLIEDEIPDAYRESQKDAFYHFTNMAGGVLDDIEELSGTSEEYLQILAWRVKQPPTRGSYAEDAAGDKYISMILEFDWGLV